MTASVPKFSVVVASHGRAGLLVQLLASLERARSATKADVEVLVIDSTPTGESEVIRDASTRFGVRVIEGSLSVRRKRNLGAQSATGDWLLFVDSDCKVSQEIFDAYQHAFETNPELCVAAGPTVFRGEETQFTRLIQTSSLLSPFRQPDCAGFLLWATTSNLLVRRDVFETIEGFREDFPFRLGGDDTDLCLRLRDKGHRVVAVPEAVCYHSWATWSQPISMARRSFRWGWMHSCLLREHPRYRRFDAPGLPVHSLACVVIAFFGALAGALQLLFVPILFIVLAVMVHAVFVSARASAPWMAFSEDLSLAFVELPFGFGRALGSLASGSLIGLLYRLDADDAAMDSRFPETVRSLWSDHIAFLCTASLIGWVT